MLPPCKRRLPTGNSGSEVSRCNAVLIVLRGLDLMDERQGHPVPRYQEGQRSHGESPAMSKMISPASFSISFPCSPEPQGQYKLIMHNREAPRHLDISSWHLNKVDQQLRLGKMTLTAPDAGS